MSAYPKQTELQLLQSVQLRIGHANTSGELETTIKKFLVPVLLKIETSNAAVKEIVLEILNHLILRLNAKFNLQVQLPIEELIIQYQLSTRVDLQNFAIIYINMGYPRMEIEQQTKLAPKLLSCCEGKRESDQYKLLLLVVPVLCIMKIPDDPLKRNSMLGLEDKPNTKKKIISLLKDVLLLPYKVTQDAIIPPGLSSYSFKRIISSNWKAEELEQLKKGIVQFICSGILNEDAFILLVLASSDTRFSVATPALTELNKICTVLDFDDPKITAPLYILSSGNDTQYLERKSTPCSAQVREKLLQYLIRSRGKGINTVRGIKVIFEGLFGQNTNQKCKILALKFCENLIQYGQKDILSNVSGVILAGISKVLNESVSEPVDIQNAAYSAITQLARTYPEVVNKDLKMVVTYFNDLSTANPILHFTIREALVSMAPAFAWNRNTKEVKDSTDKSTFQTKFIPTPQQNLLLEILTDYTQSNLEIVQDVTIVFLETCFPANYPPARYLLLLIAGDRSSLRECITSYLYGVSKKDNINYIISSIDYPEDKTDDCNKLIPKQKHIVLPNFKEMVNYVAGMNKKRFASSINENIFDLRICLLFSSGVKSTSEDIKNTIKLKEYIENNVNNENNEIYKYLQLVMSSVEAKINDTNLLCLYDLLNAAPEIIVNKQMHLLKPLAISLNNASEMTRINVAQIYGISLAYGLNDDDFNEKIAEILSSLNNKSLENRHGWILVIGHAFSRKILSLGDKKKDKDFSKWTVFIEGVKLLVRMLCEQQQFLLSSSIKSLALISKLTNIPQLEVELHQPFVEKNTKVLPKLFIFERVCAILKSTSIVPVKIREDAANCLGCLAIGDGKYFTLQILKKLLLFIKLNKSVALNITISHAIVCILNGYDINMGPPDESFTNINCDDRKFDWFLNSIIKLVGDSNSHSRESCSVWLLAIVKNCTKRPSLLAKKNILQSAFIELLSDDSDFVQDVSSRGLDLIFSLSDQNTQNNLSKLLIDQLLGSGKQIYPEIQETEIFRNSFLGKTPTGGNIKTYKELCSLALYLKQREMIYQFIQLANHNNATWYSKLDSAFGSKSILKDAKIKMKPYLNKIIPRLYRYKYDPILTIKNSMISIWDLIVIDTNKTVEIYYWDILKEILDNLTANESRVRIGSCLAVRDLLKNGLKFQSDTEQYVKIEPALQSLMQQLFRVMKDTHIGTRLEATNATNTLFKLCIDTASNKDNKSGVASILPVLLTEIHTWHPKVSVQSIHEISIKIMPDLVETSADLIIPHLARLIPCLLRTTGELETLALAQKSFDSTIIRAQEVKFYYTMNAISKFVPYIENETLSKMAPTISYWIKQTQHFGTKIAITYFICLISNRLGSKMAPVTEKYLDACFCGLSLNDENDVIQEHFAEAIFTLIGTAEGKSIEDVFIKLDDFYFKNPFNKGLLFAIQKINKRQPKLLIDYAKHIMPLIFFAKNAEITEIKNNNAELWKELWLKIYPDEADGIRMNLDSIISKFEKSLNDDNLRLKIQSANCINTIALRLKNNLNDKHCIHLLNLLLCAVQGKKFDGKLRLLEALASLCKAMKKDNEISEDSLTVAMKEIRNQYPLYIITALKTFEDIYKEFNEERYQDAYEMLLYLLNILELLEENTKIVDSWYSFYDAFGYKKHGNKPENIYIQLRETACSISTINIKAGKYNYDLINGKDCLKVRTKPIQANLLIALSKYLENLFHEEINIQKLDHVTEKICNEVLTALNYITAKSNFHIGLTLASLDLILILTKNLNGKLNVKKLVMNVEKSFTDNFEIYEVLKAGDWRIEAINSYLKDFYSKNHSHL